MARSDERAILLSTGWVRPSPAREPVSVLLPTRLRSGTGQYRQETKPDAQRRGRQYRYLAALIGGRDDHPTGRPRPSLGHVGVFRRTPGNGSSTKVGGGPGRTRTCNQTVMSVLVEPETFTESTVPERREAACSGSVPGFHWQFH